LLDWHELLFVGLAAVAAGLTNALAGGGSLITFPTLLAVGVPALPANITNTIALCPGYLGGTLAQVAGLRGPRQRLGRLLPAGVIGGLAGGILLLETGERTFARLVPFLILLACGLLAVQEPLRAWLLRRAGKNATGTAAAAASPADTAPKTQAQAPAAPTIDPLSRLTGAEAWAVLPVGLAAIYGGYFGAGLGVILLAVLGLALHDSLTRLNALKQCISLCTNVAAAVFFLFSKQVVWPAAAVMAVGALIGGALGGRLAGRIKPAMLRWVVVTLGVVAALLYLRRMY
jgi:uncharacterized protein